MQKAPKQKRVRLNISLPEDVLLRVDEEARAGDRTRSREIERAVKSVYGQVPA